VQPMCLKIDFLARVTTSFSSKLWCWLMQMILGSHN